MNETLKSAIDVAIEKFYRSTELQKEAAELIETIDGVRVITDSARLDTDGKLQIHVCRGIKQLAEVLGEELKPMKDCFGNKDYSRRCIDFDDVMFFQIGKPTKDDCFD